MDTQIVAVYCLCDDRLKALHHPEDAQSQLSDAEVMTTALVAALHFGGNLEKAHASAGIWLCAQDVEQEPLQYTSSTASWWRPVTTTICRPVVSREQWRGYQSARNATSTVSRSMC
jgi:hypothetical protein